MRRACAQLWRGWRAHAGSELAGLGFPWPPTEFPSPIPRRGRWLFECYPHPAQVVLFGLERSLKYKLKRQGRQVARQQFARYLALVRGLRSPAIAFTPALIAELDVSRAIGDGRVNRQFNIAPFTSRV